MRSRRSPAAAVVLLAIVLAMAIAAAGCGSGGTTVGGGNRAPANSGTSSVTPAGQRPAAFDPRDAPLGCILHAGIQAQKDPRETDRVDILPATSRAYVTFTSTPTEAQGVQLSNGAPGAEAIGPHLFTVGNLSDTQLSAIESCLQAQGTRY